MIPSVIDRLHIHKIIIFSPLFVIVSTPLSMLHCTVSNIFNHFGVLWHVCDYRKHTIIEIISVVNITATSHRFYKITHLSKSIHPNQLIISGVASPAFIIISSKYFLISKIIISLYKTHTHTDTHKQSRLNNIQTR